MGSMEKKCQIVSITDKTYRILNLIFFGWSNSQLALVQGMWVSMNMRSIRPYLLLPLPFPRCSQISAYQKSARLIPRSNSKPILTTSTRFTSGMAGRATALLESASSITTLDPTQFSSLSSFIPNSQRMTTPRDAKNIEIGQESTRWTL